MHSAFGATMQGLVTIRGFKRQTFVQEKFVGMLEKNAQAWYWWLIGNRWIGFRLDLLCTAIVSCSVIMGVLLRDYIESGLLGLALVYIISLSGQSIIHYESKWLQSNIWIGDVFLLSDPSTLGAGSQRSQPKHVSNPDSVIKKFKAHLIYD